MPPTTKDRILDSAELLFAELGVANTSLRTLTEHAGVNLASVNYHFQSKDALVQAVLFRRLNPINQKRMELVNQLLHTAPDGRPALEDTLDAFYRPVVEAVFASRAAGRPISALIGRIYTEPGELIAGQIRAMMSQVVSTFFDAIHLALPNLPQSTLFWRLQFSIGAMSHTFGAMHLIEGLARGRVRTNDPEEILQELIRYAAGGLRSPAP